MERGTVLDEAKKVINGDRQDTYGGPEDSFADISEYWNTYIKRRFGTGPVNLEPKDIAMMMVLFKIAREANQGKRDNLVDAAGYLGIAGDFKKDLNSALVALAEMQEKYLSGFNEPEFNRFEPTPEEMMPFNADKMCQAFEYHG